MATNRVTVFVLDSNSQEAVAPYKVAATATWQDVATVAGVGGKGTSLEAKLPNGGKAELVDAVTEGGMLVVSPENIKGA